MAFSFDHDNGRITQNLLRKISTKKPSVVLQTENNPQKFTDETKRERNRDRDRELLIFRYHIHVLINANLRNYSFHF